MFYFFRNKCCYKTYAVCHQAPCQLSSFLLQRNQVYLIAPWLLSPTMSGCLHFYVIQPRFHAISGLWCYRPLCRAVFISTQCRRGILRLCRKGYRPLCRAVFISTLLPRPERRLSPTMSGCLHFYPTPSEAQYLCGFQSLFLHVFFRIF